VEEPRLIESVPFSEDSLKDMERLITPPTEFKTLDEESPEKPKKHVEKRTFLKKRSGLLRFFRDPDTAAVLAPSPLMSLENPTDISSNQSKKKKTVKSARVKGRNSGRADITSTALTKMDDMKSSNKFQRISYNGKSEAKTNCEIKKSLDLEDEEPIWLEKIAVVEKGINPLVLKNPTHRTDKQVL